MHKNNRFLGNSNSSNILLRQSYEVVWIYWYEWNCRWRILSFKSQIILAFHAWLVLITTTILLLPKIPIPLPSTFWHQGALIYQSKTLTITKSRFLQLDLLGTAITFYLRYFYVVAFIESKSYKLTGHWSSVSLCLESRVTRSIHNLLVDIFICTREGGFICIDCF